jgi:hypothetical protein
VRGRAAARRARVRSRCGRGRRRQQHAARVDAGTAEVGGHHLRALLGQARVAGADHGGIRTYVHRHQHAPVFDQGLRQGRKLAAQRRRERGAAHGKAGAGRQLHHEALVLAHHRGVRAQALLQPPEQHVEVVTHLAGADAAAVLGGQLELAPRLFLPEVARRRRHGHRRLRRRRGTLHGRNRMRDRRRLDDRLGTLGFRSTSGEGQHGQRRGCKGDRAQRARLSDPGVGWRAHIRRISPPARRR